MNVTIDDVSGTINDTYLWEAAPNNNYGNSTTFRSGDTRTALIYVDLSDYSGIGEVVSAHFNLHQQTASPDPITLDWWEVLVDWVYSQVDWNTRKDGFETEWIVAGCKGVGTDRNAVKDGTGDYTNVYEYKTLPITPALAYKWATDINNGLAIDSLDVGSVLFYTSSEGADKPSFYMEYTESKRIYSSSGYQILRRGRL